MLSHTIFFVFFGGVLQQRYSETEKRRNGETEKWRNSVVQTAIQQCRVKLLPMMNDVIFCSPFRFSKIIIHRINTRMNTKISTRPFATRYER